MGGFWAYESLSFGGYWAWDPVENASLVPWLLLISGIHLMLIKKVTNSSTIAAYTLVISTYIMVLYASFLTRSGVLGETSVHSFTDLGLAGQLMQFVVLCSFGCPSSPSRQGCQETLVHDHARKHTQC